MEQDLRLPGVISENISTEEEEYRTFKLDEVVLLSSQLQALRFIMIRGHIKLYKEGGYVGLCPT